MAENAQPIIVKRVRKGGHGGHHGGSWKVAYADFVTAMMAFFLLLWLLNVSNDEILKGISEFFKNPSIVHAAGGASTSVINIGKQIDSSKGDGDHQRESNEQDMGDAHSVLENIERRQMEEIKAEIEQTIEQDPALLQIKDQVLMDVTDEGLRIQIVDKQNRPMFDSASAELKWYAKKLLKQIAPILNDIPNSLSITGHTDARLYMTEEGYGNWELSSDRANAARRELLDAKLDPEKISRVTGMASRLLFNAADPLDPNNRRISILVHNRKGEERMYKGEGDDSKPRNTFTPEQLREAVGKSVPPRPAETKGKIQR